MRTIVTRTGKRSFRRGLLNCTLYISLILALFIVVGCKSNSNFSDQTAFAQAMSYYKAKEYESAYKLFLKLAKDGNPQSQAAIGGFYYYGLGLTKDYSKAAFWFEKAATSGVQEAMNTLAHMYRYGEGVVKDCRECVYWYEMASNAGNTKAMYNLSYLYSSGVCVKKDKDVVIAYLQRASQIGDEYGKLCKGIALYSGTGVAIDYVEARLLFEEIAHNNEYACIYLYDIYFRGLRVNRNIPLAVEYLERASESDLAIADYYYAVMYFKGDYFERNYSEAFRYAMKSGKRNPGCAYLLGILYEKGLGVSVDYGKAKRWYRLAVGMGSERAQKRLSALQ